MRASLTRGIALVSAVWLALGATAASAQVDGGGAIGEWRTHLPFGRAIDVSACESFTAYATASAVVLVYADSDEVRRLDKVNALTQANPRFVACNPFRDGETIVAYADGAIDVLDGERVRHFTREITDTDIFGERDLTRVSYLTPDRAAVCAEFGFLLFDPAEGLFREDVRTPAAVTDVAVFEGDLYVSTLTGLLRLRDYANQPLLRDLDRYEDLSATLLGAPGAATYGLGEWRGELIVGGSGPVYAVAPGGERAETLFDDGCLRAVELSPGPDFLAMQMSSRCGGDLAYVIDGDRRVLAVETRLCSERLGGVVERPEGGFVFAGASEGSGLCATPGLEGECACLTLNGPRAATAFDIDAEGGTVAVASGSIAVNGDYTFNGAGIYVLRPDGTWTNYNAATNAGFATPSAGDGATPLDFVTVTLAPDGAVYAGAYYEGLVRVGPDGAGELFDERNSSLGLFPLDPSRVRIGGTAVDAAGNLWIGNYGARRALSARTPAGEWFSFDVSGCGRSRLRDVEVDPRTGIVWALDFENGVLAYDPGPDLADESDDRCRRFDASDGPNGELPSTDVTSLLIDREGVVWVGTVNGIARVTCAADPFAETCRATRPTSEVDGIRGFFFEGETVTAMTSDGGDRKYVGTRNGLFLLGADDDRQLDFYTEDNSPLLSDEITALDFDAATGLLWVGTARGLMSLRTESTGGDEFVFGAVEVYPQPVRPDYEGPIAIRGLARDANVKITDAAGRLVYETDAIGGQAVWDGRDYTGRRPASGVYLVWASATQSFDSPEAVVAKIALLR